jgi:2-polyprenyl-3-methyl-5-hydroxy-6-metoxy-1,4-benzoquinol methylase
VKTYDPQTLNFYAAEADTYVGHRLDKIDSAVAGLLERLKPGARILELGCGGGIDAAHMIALGFDVDPTDGVAEMAAQAEARLARPVRVMRFDELDAVEAYDAVIANASLLHVPVAGLTPILRRVWNALKPDGWHLATYKTASAESRDEHGRYYNYLAQDEADRQYKAAGDWSSIDYEEWAGIGYFSAPAQWLKVVARKQA